MHYVTSKGILSSKNGINLYRGCQHGCIYCDSRSNCYNMDHDFEDIEIKENAVTLLENALRHKRKKCMIGTGAMTDPYIPLEAKIGNMRDALCLIDRECEKCEKFDIVHSNDALFSYLNKFEDKSPYKQLDFF